MLRALLLAALHDIFPKYARDVLGVFQGSGAVGLGEGGLGAELVADLRLRCGEDGRIACHASVPMD